MAIKVTEEIIKQINELYLEYGVKKKVADIVGCSPATVTKYLIDGYVSERDNVEVTFDISNITGPNKNLISWQEFADSCKLTEEEWAEIRTIQEGLMI